MDQTTQCVILVNTREYLPKKAEIEKLFTDHECRVTSFVPTLGTFDLCMVVECRNSEQVATCCLIGRQTWGWKTQTLPQAIAPDKFDSVIEQTQTRTREYAGARSGNSR